MEINDIDRQTIRKKLSSFLHPTQNTYTNTGICYQNYCSFSLILLENDDKSSIKVDVVNKKNLALKIKEEFSGFFAALCRLVSMQKAFKSAQSL